MLPNPSLRVARHLVMIIATILGPFIDKVSRRFRHMSPMSMHYICLFSVDI